MPDSYLNPSYKPPTRPYKWVPDVIPAGGDTPIGFYPNHIVRGSFRNDIPVQEGYSGGTITITKTGTLISSEGSENNPILAVHRYRADPDNDRGAPPSEKFDIKGADFKWEAEFNQSVRISAITIEYALVVDLNDPALLNFLQSDDKSLLERYLQNPTNEPPGIDWSKYHFAKITLDDIEFPANGADGKSKELSVTGTTKTTKKHTVKFVESFVSSSFPLGKKIAISNRIGLSTLELILEKVYIFEANGVNLHDEQLPCSLMEYAYPVRFSFTPSPNMNAQRLPFPSDSSNPNFHIKIFSPEEIIANKYGFAHSINLRFLIFSMPILGIDPTGINPLYFVVFIGPSPGRKTIKVALSGKQISSNVANVNKNRVVVTDSVLIEKDTQSIRLEKIESTTSISPPLNNANWKRVDDSTYVISGGNIFDTNGPYVSEYLFLDKSTSEFNWYRTVQSLNSGGEKYSAPFKNSTYSEKVIYSALPSATTSTKKDSIVRHTVLIDDFINKDPLNANKPIAIFVTDGFDAFSQSNQFRKGSFKLAIRAKVDDPDYLLNTHIFARFWFVPYDSDIDVNNLYANRTKDNEFYFETTTIGTKLVNGNPTSMQHVIISPPIPNTLTYLEMTRYNDVAIKKPAGNHKLMIALYTASYPSSDGEKSGIDKNTINFPKITLELDTQYSSFETTLEQTTSNILFAQRAEKYNSSQFVTLDKPLIVTINKVGGEKLNDEIFPKYDSKFNSNNNNPFAGLLKFDKNENGTLAKFCIPITAVPGSLDEKILVYADFATNGLSLDSGRVLNGKWDIEFTTNRGVDTSIVAIDYRLEMFLVNGDGKVTERIFRSSIIDGVTNSGESTVTYSTSIQLPMIIGGSGTQLVARLIGYPYSRDGSSVDVSSVQNQLGDIPFGLRIESFQIKEHTISRLAISQVASSLGSPAFYEDLQLTPNQSFGQTSDFWFIVSDFLTNTIVVDVNNGIDITGCLYSPAWFINMPKDMEVKSRGQGFKDNDVWFRTVVADGAIGESAITAVEDKMSKTVHIAYKSEDSVSGQSVSMMSNSSVIKHKTFDSPYRKSLQDNNIAGKNNGEILNLENTSPNFQFINMGGFDNNNQAVLGLISQIEGGDYAAAQANMNTALGGYGTWFGSNRDLGGADFSSVKKFANGFSSLSMAQSPVSSLTYVAGWAAPGSILLKEANIWDSNTTGADGSIYLVDGVSNNPIPDSSPVIQPSFTSGLKAVQTFPGILIDSYNRVIVAYTLEGRSGELFARHFVGGQGMSNPYVIATFRSGGLTSSDVDIFAPTMFYHIATQSYYVAMWCGGKIFLTTFNGLKSSNGVLINPIQLVAGNKDFNNEKNSANPIFKSLIQSGALINNVLGDAEDDIPQQRVGLFVSDKWPFQGNAFVYYKNSNDKLMVRQVRVGGVTGTQSEVV